jgi:non-ribosomal peptide synthetase component F
VLLATMHHIASDGWSMGVLGRELGRRTARVERRAVRLPELPVQYADYAVWQRRWLAGEVLEQELQYWRERLAGVAVLELPLDRRRPAVQTYAGAVEVVRIPRELGQGLARLGQQEGATLYQVVLAAFASLMSRLTGQEDVAVGSPIANRTRREVEELVGFFVNSLVMRTDVSGDPTYREVLARVKAGSVEAQAHQHLPFERLVEELAPARSLSVNPLFQVMFAVQNAPGGELLLPGVRVEPLGQDAVTTRFDMELHFWEGARGLELLVIYNRDLLEAGTVRRMAGQYERLLEGVVRDPGARVSRVELRDAEERGRVARWSARSVELPAEGSIHGCFERVAREHAEEPAVEMEGRVVSYGHLDRQANAVARALLDEGMGREGAWGCG